MVVSVVLVNKFDRSMVGTRRVRSNMQFCVCSRQSMLDLLQRDISDERIAIQREEAITDNKFMTIHDRTKDESTVLGSSKENQTLRV